jgi:hypothetical protein
MLSAFNTRTHLGAYLSEINYFLPNGIVGFVNTEILRGFADASGHDIPSERVLTVNGCLSTSEKWQAFDDDWQDYLMREHFIPDETTGRYVFHTSPFKTGNLKSMPKNFSRAARERVYSNLFLLIQKHTLYRFGFGILLEDFRRFENDYPFAREMFFKQPGTYVSKLCFQSNSTWAEANGFNSAISYTFDQGDAFWGELFEEYRNARRETTSNELTVSQLSDGNKIDFSPIQAADIIAWECRKYFLNLSPEHLYGSVKKRPSPELMKVNEEGKANFRLYRYEELESEVGTWAEECLEVAEKTDLFANPKDFAQKYFYWNKILNDEEKEELRQRFFDKREERRKAYKKYEKERIK